MQSAGTLQPGLVTLHLVAYHSNLVYVCRRV